MLRVAFALPLLLAALAFPAASSALTASYTKTIEDEVAFELSGCGSVDQWVSRTRTGASIKKIRGPQVGQVLGDGYGRQIATVTKVERGGPSRNPTVTWVVQASHQACAEPLGLESTEQVTLKVGYRFKKRLVLGPNELRSDARDALSSRFGDAWDQGYGRRLRCRRTSSLTGRCRFSWVIGDGEYVGTLRSRKRVRRRRPYPGSDDVVIRNRGGGKLYDAYCLDTGGRNCVKRFRIRFY